MDNRFHWNNAHFCKIIKAGQFVLYNLYNPEKMYCFQTYSRVSGMATSSKNVPFRTPCNITIMQITSSVSCQMKAQHLMGCL